MAHFSIKCDVVSTFTYIQTRMYDANALARILGEIPGAQVRRNVVMPMKFGGGVITVEVHVTMPNALATGKKGFLSGLIQALSGVQEFWALRAPDGSLMIEINHDSGNAGVIQAAVRQVFASEEQKQELHRREQDQLRQRQLDELRLRQEQLAAEAEHQRLLREAEAAKEALRKQESLRRQRAEQAKNAAAEAEMILKRLEEEQLLARQAAVAAKAAQDAEAKLKALTAAANSKPGKDSITPDFNVSPEAEAGSTKKQADEALAAALSQEYAKEMILGQQDEMEAKWGVYLDQMRNLDDGTIEITLKG